MSLELSLNSQYLQVTSGMFFRRHRSLHLYTGKYALRRRVPRCFSDYFESRDSLPCCGFEPFSKRLRIVGHEFCPVPCAADLDVEALLDGEL